MAFSQRVASRSNWRGLALLGLLTLAGATAAQAQNLNYGLPTASTAAGTYTDLGTTGTVITTANNDDANSTAQSIGFTFNYNGANFSQFVLNTNGLLRLGSTAPSSAALYPSDPQNATANVAITSPDANDVNLLLPFNHDLEGGSAGAEYRVATTGTAPNRVCTIQWKNVSDKAGTTAAGSAVTKQYANISFQVKLYETTNVIEYVYGSATAATGTTDNFKHITVGLKGSGGSQGQVLLATKASVSAWSTTTFLDAIYTGNAFNIRSTVLPDAGRTLRFLPLYANDAEVQVVYTMAKLPRGAGAPHIVQAVVRNVGTTAQTVIPVTLSISGANSFSSSKVIQSLPVGGSATVTFDPFTPANLGNNTVTVSLLPDDNATNNSKAMPQAVTDNVYGYAGSTPTGSSVLGLPTTSALGGFAVKYTTASARTLTAVNAYISSSAAPNASVGRTIYAVAFNAAGNLIGRTPDYVIQTADVSTVKTFTFPTPISLTPGDFLVGIAQINGTGATQFYPIATQAENPTRTGTFAYFTALNTSGTNTFTDLGTSNFGAYLIDAVLNTTTGVSKQLQSAVSVYPNPSNGEFTLAIAGAGAKNGLKVEVSNVLGQRVYAGSARDNFSNSLNLSHLSSGLYTVKVSDGDQYMLRTIDIRK